MKKKVSIIIATKNRSEFLAGCIQSILKQTILNQIEVLVIDKSSSDKDKKIVDNYQKQFKNIKYLRQRSTGLYAAWNIGIKNAKGKYLINLNTDDRLKSNAIENLSSALDQNINVALVFGDSYITNKPFLFFEENRYSNRLLDLPQYSRKELYLRCICGPHPMWRRKLHKEVGYFNTNYKVSGDYEFWLRISEKYEMLHIKKVVGLYYKNPQGLASSKKMLEIKNHENLRIKKKYLN
jgi:glycosyltransferase involved in cell wall biosynthesis